MDKNSLPLLTGVTWAFIPARGGSKSIPQKNLLDLAGKPMLMYVVEAAKSCAEIERIICSTDSKDIALCCEASGIEVQQRPKELGGDDVATIDVILYFLEKTLQAEKVLPEFLVLLEPTSPFVLRHHISTCIEVLRSDSEADSAQTVARVAPNSHAFNQRFHDKNGSHFVFPEKRKESFNKQTKPDYFMHGNVRVMRVVPLLKNKTIFGQKSLPTIIPRLYAMDVDGPEDVEVALSVLATGTVKLGMS